MRLFNICEKLLVFCEMQKKIYFIIIQVIKCKFPPSSWYFYFTELQHLQTLRFMEQKRTLPLLIAHIVVSVNRKRGCQDSFVTRKV